MNWEFLGKIFLAPANLAFLGLIPVVILLYLLKLRRTRVVISSTLLWRKSLQDLTANAPFQRLRRNLLLLLQVLILLLVIAGLARPFMKAEGTSGNDLCLMIDRSASMQTREGARTRLDKAKDKALGMIDQMASGDKMMVVTFASGSDVLCELTDDRYQLRNAIRSIAAADSCTRIRDAMLVANSLQASRPGLRTVVVSDGRIADLDAVGSRAFDVDFLQVGEPAGNAGIVAFSVRNPSEEGYATSSPEAREFDAGLERRDACRGRGQPGPQGHGGGRIRAAEPRDRRSARAPGSR
jgi:Ca-activated chloride channel family protein